MPTIQEQFEYKRIPDYFEKDTHTEVQGLEIDSIKVLYGESSDQDITVVRYAESPNLSFYNFQGKLIDIDHYLPDKYQEEDRKTSETIIGNLKNVDEKANHVDMYSDLLDALNLKDNELWVVLHKKHGLNANRASDNHFFETLGFDSSKSKLKVKLKSSFKTYFDFLSSYVTEMQKHTGGYVHFTPNDNIIITALNKSSGIAIIIETQDVNGHLLPPNKWIISRTISSENLKQVLVFRTEDVKNFFKADGHEFAFETERYKLYHEYNEISIDSYLDNTDNLLSIPLINNCYQILAVDNNIIVALSNYREITIINTHKSVVPQKWPKKVVLPDEVTWMRADENLTMVFVQDEKGIINAIDISTEHSATICSIGEYLPKFEIDQNGHIIAVTKDHQLVKIQTNSNNLILEENQQNFTKIFKDISHLFHGESLFAQTIFAKPIEEKVISEEILTDLDSARYDFEANIERLIVKCGNDYDKLLDVREKLAIARQNIADEIVKASEKAGVFLVGQRLQSTINQIVRPSQVNLRGLIEYSRADWIINTCREFLETVNDISNPGSFHEMLNSIRQFESEINLMTDENRDRIINEFKTAQQKLGALFSDQMSRDGASLNEFISAEIKQVEDSINETHDPRQLEILLTTHPAAIELFALLKQPYLLQHINAFKNFSPTEIQTRLFASIQKRKKKLQVELEKKEKEQHKAKLQLVKMIEKSILFFVQNHSKGFSDVELSENANYQSILSDILILERNFKDIRLSMDLRRKLEKRIIERNREDLEKMVAYEGKYAYINNDPDLYVDLESTATSYPIWTLDLLEKKGMKDVFSVIFVRDVDKEMYRPSTLENLEARKAFEITEDEYGEFSNAYNQYSEESFHYELLNACWLILCEKESEDAFPQFTVSELRDVAPKSKAEEKALRCALEKKRREYDEKNRNRDVPKIPSEFIDETPYFQSKLHEFLIKSKIQLVSGSGIILLSGPPSTGKSAFLRFVSSLMNREYFEHASDKWQTKNSLVTAIKFGEYGPYSIPAGFTKAITTPHALINIEEIKEWPEALRKSLNPFFAGSPYFLSPDGTQYKIGSNILLCAAANLGAMYRQDDEPFTADFWSRVEVVEYDYAPIDVNKEYIDSMFKVEKTGKLTMQDLAREYFEVEDLPTQSDRKAKFISQKFIEFILLPKADEKIKKEKLENEIRSFFREFKRDYKIFYSGEESAKIALKRCTLLQGYKLEEYFELYNHFINQANLNTTKLAQIQMTNTAKYAQLKILFNSLLFIELCLRLLRDNFYKTAGQTEIEGTNREFIQCVHLLNLVGKI